MPFFTVLLHMITKSHLEALIFIAQSSNKNATLQVRAPFKKQIYCRRKRVCLFSSASQWMKGSLSIEAAMGLSLFLFACICMMMPMVMMDRQRQIQAKLEKTGEQMSQYAYVGQEENFLMYGSAALGKGSILTGIDKRGIEDITFWKSRIMRDGETIKLVMDYKMKLPFSALGLKSIPMESVSIHSAWIGRDGPLGNRTEGDLEDQTEPQQEMVFIGKNGTRYHKTPDCHYLSNAVEIVAYEELEGKRNNAGRKYRPCRICGKGAAQSGSVYIMPEGESYHSMWNCPATVAYIKEVPLEEVKHLGECSYCW